MDDGLSLLGALDAEQKTYMKRGAAIGAVAAVGAMYFAKGRHSITSYLVRGLLGVVLGTGAGYGVVRLK